MFSLYSRGLKSTAPDGILEACELHQYIMQHPNKDEIERLHTLEYQCDEYVMLKETLPCITAHGIFRGKKRKSELLKLSGYLYFDVDALQIPGDLQAYKNHLISKYGSIISILGTSVGGRGVFFYVKVEGLNAQNFNFVHWHFLTSVFGVEPIDKKAKGITRVHILPYDPNVFFAPDNVSNIPINIPSNELKDDGIVGTAADDNERFSSFIPINTLLSTLVFETMVDTEGKMFKICPEPYYKLYFPRHISDGRKHTTFRALTQGLMFLNKDISKLEVLSYINFINVNYTTVPMRRKEMINTVLEEYKRVTEVGEINISLKTKTLHFHKSVAESTKRRLAPYINGLLKTLYSVLKIQDAKSKLLTEGIKPTSKVIAEKAGISNKTVQRNSGKNPVDILMEIESCNAIVEDI